MGMSWHGISSQGASERAGCRCRLQEWAQSVHEDMDPNKETVLLCHHGVRSMQVAGFLAAQVTASSCPQSCAQCVCRLLLLCQNQ